jgi:hypothetical protein
MLPTNKQEIFETVINHLAKQKKQAVSNVQCSYRTKEGESCAIGCMIPNEMYDSTFEGGDVFSLFNHHIKEFEVWNTPDMRPFLKMLQMAHDGAAIHPLTYEFTDVYGIYGLQTKLMQIAYVFELNMPYVNWASFRAE